MRIEFLPNIQGLRALAVVAVVAFHAFPALLPGGFIGVDVFFVISGYLISGILYRSLAAHEFSFADFYARRAKRIFPALILVMGSCLAFGFFALLPEELDQLGIHTAGGAGFISNLLLWREAGYFDNSAASKPLLHLWSLGVEEQFYLVWPVLLFLAWKRRRALVPVTVALAVASFAYNLAEVQNNPLAAFYSPLSRFWEIAVGSLLAYHHFCRDEGTAAPVPGLDRWGGSGAMLLCAGFFWVDNSRPFPGLWALIPVGATALLLAAGARARFNRSVLSHRFMLWIGSISYPLYLWHWPLFSYAHILQAENPSNATRVLAIGASVLLAWLTYRGIEIRFKSAPRTRLAAAWLACGIAVTASAGWGIHLYHGLPQRQIANLGKYLPQDPAPTPPQAQAQDQVPNPPQDQLGAQGSRASVHMAPDSAATVPAINRMRAHRKADPLYFGKFLAEKNVLQRYKTCHIYDTAAAAFENYLPYSAQCTALAQDKKNVLVYGDSAAAEMYLMLKLAYPDINFVQITGSACKPFHAAYQNMHYCVKMLDFALSLLDRHSFDGVVVASQWRDDFALALPDLLHFRAKDRPLLLIGPPLTFSEDATKTMARMEQGESLQKALEGTLDPDNVKLAGTMGDFAKRNGFAYLDRLQLYCESGCPLISAKGDPMILDKFHLTLPGIAELSKRIKANKALDAALALP